MWLATQNIKLYFVIEIVIASSLYSPRWEATGKHLTLSL